MYGGRNTSCLTNDARNQAVGMLRAGTSIRLQLQHSSGFMQRFVTTVYDIVTNEDLHVLQLPNRSPYPVAECTKQVENCYINTRKTHGRYNLRINTLTVHRLLCENELLFDDVQWICARTATSPVDISWGNQFAMNHARMDRCYLYILLY